MLHFLRHGAEAVDEFCREGVDVRGYFYWSLLDNFEWDKGFWPRFGLVGVDYDDQERIVRKSALFYAQICKDNTLETESI